ncbi:hypothetical protein JMN32_15835 [Fulvivirga sp. 29W222]|uniref:Uncharacterized protein n=1 Tax=Fulvivirga marina TaxID=2494733 RepID=A0A937FX49_9BACT|nr:hypothetical protein [Fulvivirga marina]MBL6447790.1 hypothetical protein [Fulvivirga marina]
MKKIKRTLRLIAFILFVLLAAFGAGIGGAIFPTYQRREEQPDINIEMVDKKKNENAEEDSLYKL